MSENERARLNNDRRGLSIAVLLEVGVGVVDLIHPRFQIRLALSNRSVSKALPIRMYLLY